MQSSQTILELKDPRDLPRDLIFYLIEKGEPLIVVEDVAQIFNVLQLKLGQQ